MPARVRIAAAAAVALGALAGMVALIVHIRSVESGVGHLRFATSLPARAPFDRFDETLVAVGPRCLRVLVASDPSQRVQGLREVGSLVPYDGMLFVMPNDTNAHFTMADTPLPLDIVWFAANRAQVDRAQMTPCPTGTDASCPEYASKAPYRYALETASGSAPGAGAIGACA